MHQLFFVRQLEAVHRPVHRQDGDVYPARICHVRAQLCQGEVVPLAEEARHERQCLSVEYATPTTGVRRSGQPAGQPASAQHLLDKVDADAALAGELTSQAWVILAHTSEEKAFMPRLYSL